MACQGQTSEKRAGKKEKLSAEDICFANHVEASQHFSQSVLFFFLFQDKMAADSATSKHNQQKI